MCRGILLQEEKLHNEVDRHLYPLSSLVQDLALLVLAQWHKSNANFKPPVMINDKSFADKIKRKWEDLVDVVNGRTNKSIRERSLIDLLGGQDPELEMIVGNGVYQPHCEASPLEEVYPYTPHL